MMNSLKEQSSEVPKEEEDEEPPKPVKMTVDKVDHEGNIHFEFNQPLVVPNFFNSRRLLGEIDFSKIDVSRDIMSIYMVSYDDSDDKPSKYYLSMKDFNDRGMIINVNFTNPEKVSSTVT